MQDQMFLVTTQDSAAILPTVDRAGDYVLGILQGIIEKGASADLRIRTRPAEECKLFLDGAVPAAMQPLSKDYPLRKEEPAKKHKKAAGGGGQTVPKAHKPAAPAKVKKGSNRSLVLAFINACTKETAVDAPAICKATKLKIESVSPMLTELFKIRLIDRIEGKPLRFFKKTGTASAPQPGPDKIMCKGKGRIILIDQCKPNDASPICKKCEHIEH